MPAPSSRLCSFFAVAISASAATIAPGAPQITYAKDIAPILQEKCESCHRDGQGAPMSLQNYDEIRPWARSIKYKVGSRQMPPWNIDPSVGIKHFSNDRSLTPEQISLIEKWVDAGAPLGDKKDLPPQKVWPPDSGWQLAKVLGQEPDFVVKSTPYTVNSVNQDEWWKPTTDIGIDEVRWVRAVEMRTGTIEGRKVTHHALASLEQVEPGADPADRASGPGLLMEWAIGKTYDIYRPGSGKLLEPGAKIRWEVHYHAVGEKVTDHVELAIFLYTKGYVPEHRTRLQLFTAYKTNNDLDIPPNSIAATQAFHVLKSAARIENFQPHMHLRGTAMSMEAILPDGEVRMLSFVKDFNFNWMNNYIYADDAAPVLPKGTVLRITAYYDNTDKHKGNPDPDQWIGYGDRTIDEMGHAWVNVTNLSDADYAAWAAEHKAPVKTTRAGD